MSTLSVFGYFLFPVFDLLPFSIMDICCLMKCSNDFSIGGCVGLDIDGSKFVEVTLKVLFSL